MKERIIATEQQEITPEETEKRIAEIQSFVDEIKEKDFPILFNTDNLAFRSLIPLWERRDECNNAIIQSIALKYNKTTKTITLQLHENDAAMYNHWKTYTFPWHNNTDSQYIVQYYYTGFLKAKSAFEEKFGEKIRRKTYEKIMEETGSNKKRLATILTEKFVDPIKRKFWKK